MSVRVPKAALSMAERVAASMGCVSIFRGMRRKGKVLLHVIYSVIVMNRIKRETKKVREIEEVEEREGRKD
jgi:hypothetical protein